MIGILLALLFWGPKKLPELARAVGSAKREFQQAKSDVSSFTSNLPQPKSPTETQENSLIVAARSVGVATDGMTRQEIGKDVAEKASQKSGS